MHRLIRDHQIQLVRICVQDSSNIARSKYVPVQQFLQHVLYEGISFPSALFDMDTASVLQADVGQGFSGGYPSYQLRVDPATFSILPFTQGEARIIADVYDDSGSQITFAPRTVLQRVVSRLREHGYHVRGAFEYEFYVFEQTNGQLKPVWEGLHCFSETKQAEVAHIIQAVLQGLSHLGAEPEVANTEYGSGQFEVTYAPHEGIAIADMAFYYRTAIKEIIHKLGYTATFMSKPIANMSGSGAHLHHSLWSVEGVNLFADNSQVNCLSDIGRWFIGGQLKFASALSLFINPTVNAYKRLQPYTFAPTRVTWGFENRCAMIRIPRQRGAKTRIENRLPGADTNPYLALAALLAAGLYGIEQQIEPPHALQGQDAYQIGEVLPKTLYEALEHAHLVNPEEAQWFEQILGPEFIKHHESLRRTEWDRYMAHVSDWEMNEYFSIF
ncbi:glutamine synthetase family protein [Sulfoacidibacillus thermotolerans]|uniref:glutamine synthetase family protein n=1 Tax=Sulfoacidibacillus thermotolerans TaxID=1765684 RepID=UPI001FE53E59|nr:glutamine synthetase family protein [Sulfoacidibacillus thermotolerans]